MTVFHYTPVKAKQFDGLTIDGLAGKRQKRQNFPCQNFVLYGILLSTFLLITQVDTKINGYSSHYYWFIISYYYYYGMYSQDSKPVVLLVGSLAALVWYSHKPLSL